MRRAISKLAVAALALLALAACSQMRQSTPAWIGCRLEASESAALQRKVTACTGLIDGGGLKAGELQLALRLRADGERRLGRYDAAIADYGRAIGLDSADGAAFSGRGLAYYGQEKLDLAAADFDRALRLDPDDAGALNGRAYVERRKGDVAGVIRDENRAIELKPDWSDPWGERGLAYLDKRWWDMALADFQDALARDGRLAYALEGSGDAWRGKGDGADAAKAYLGASDAYFGQKDWDDAVYESGKALEVRPDDPGALNSRCWTRAIADEDLDLALADCRRSLAIRPGDAPTLDSLAFVRFRQDRLREALAGFDAALAKDPKQAASLYMRGIVKYRLGDQDGGQSDIAAAEKVDPEVAGRYADWGVAAPPSSDGGQASQ